MASVAQVSYIKSLKEADITELYEKWHEEYDKSFIDRYNSLLGTVGPSATNRLTDVDLFTMRGSTRALKRLGILHGDLEEHFKTAPDSPEHGNSANELYDLALSWAKARLTSFTFAEANLHFCQIGDLQFGAIHLAGVVDHLANLDPTSIETMTVSVWEPARLEAGKMISAPKIDSTLGRVAWAIGDVARSMRSDYSRNNLIKPDLGTTEGKLLAHVQQHIGVDQNYWSEKPAQEESEKQFSGNSMELVVLGLSE